MAFAIDSTTGVTFPDNSVQAVAGSRIVSMGQQTVSGTAIDFTSIPANAKRITVYFTGVSTNGANAIQVQLGTSGGVQATGYNCRLTTGTTGWNSVATITTGFGVIVQAAAQFVDGTLRLYPIAGVVNVIYEV